MKYAIVISVSKTKFGPIVFRGDLEENIVKVKNIGYNGVELAIKNPELVNIDRVKSILEKNNLTVLAIGTGQIYFDDGLSFSDPDKDIRSNAVGRTKEIIDLASHFKASIIIGLIRGKVKEGLNNFEYSLSLAEERIADCLKECLEYSIRFSTNFLLEPINRYETNIFNRLDEVSTFLKKYKNRLDLDRIGILADTFHMNIEEPVIEDSFKKFMNQIKHVHFADSNRWAPGYGHIDFHKIYEVLKKNKYDNFVSFEMLPFPEPDVSARMALEFVKKLDL